MKQRVAVVAILVAVIILTVMAVIPYRKLPTLPTSEIPPIEFAVLDQDTAIEEFVQKAGLTAEQQGVLESSAAGSAINVIYELNDPCHAQLDGYGYSVGNNLRKEHSFTASFEFTDHGWVAYDWSWVITPSIGLPAGEYTTDTNTDGEHYILEVSYTNDNFTGTYARISVYKYHYSEVVDTFYDLDYGAILFKDSVIIFDYRDDLDNEIGELRFKNDGTVQWNDLDLKQLNGLSDVGRMQYEQRI